MHFPDGRPGLAPALCRIVRVGSVTLLLGVAVMLASCVSFSPFLIREAELPEDWPKLTPVGEVRVQEYPDCRAAVVTSERAGGGTDEMFNVLFRHIKSEGIPMTAPVDMGFSRDDVAAGPRNMAFLYRSPRQGKTGTRGRVEVMDVPRATFVSLGMRGSYRPAHIDRHVARLKSWLDAHPEWRAIGPPRYLGYNSPFVPPLLRYGEVQIPVARVTENTAGPSADTRAPSVP